MKFKNMMAVAMAGGLLVTGSSMQGMDKLSKMGSGLVAVVTEGIQLDIARKTSDARVKGAQDIAHAVIMSNETCAEAIREYATAVKDGVEAAVEPLEKFLNIIAILSEKVVGELSASQRAKLDGYITKAREAIRKAKSIVNPLEAKEAADKQKAKEAAEAAASPAAPAAAA